MFTTDAVELVAADHRRRLMAQAEASRLRHTATGTPAEAPARRARSFRRSGVAFGRRPATSIVAALHRS
jgi:hypothetical protein